MLWVRRKGECVLIGGINGERLSRQVCSRELSPQVLTMGIFSREKIIGGGKPSGFYAGCYRDPETARAARKSGCRGSIRC